MGEVIVISVPAISDVAQLEKLVREGLSCSYYMDLSSCPALRHNLICYLADNVGTNCLLIFS